MAEYLQKAAAKVETEQKLDSMFIIGKNGIKTIKRR